MRKRLRIAVWHNLPSGGGKRALHGHVKGLLERGHQLEAWCPPTSDRSYLPLNELIPENVVPIDDAINKRDGRWSAPWSVAIMKRRLSAMDRHCQECCRQINRGGFDVLFANSCVFFRMPPMARHASVPSSIYLQEPYRWLYEALPRLPWIARPDSAWSVRSSRNFVADLFVTHSLRVQMRAEIANAEAFDRIFVNSSYSRESVLRAYGIDSTVCQLGIDVEHFQPTGEPPERFVLGMGNVSTAKGPDRAIHAIAKIGPEKRPPLIWIGNSSDVAYENHLRELAVRLGVQLSIKVLVSDQQLISLLSRASMLLYTPRLEPFGLAPLEANACGTPVVAVAEGGVRETIHNGVNGFLVDNDSAVELSKVMERLLDNSELSGRMRRQAVEFVRERWPMSAAIDRLERLLYALADSELNHSRQFVGGAELESAH